MPGDGLQSTVRNRTWRLNLSHTISECTFWKFIWISQPLAVEAGSFQIGLDFGNFVGASKTEKKGSLLWFKSLNISCWQAQLLFIISSKL